MIADSVAGGTSGPGSLRRVLAVAAMVVGAFLGAWLTLHHGLGIPLLIAALAAGVFAVTASGRE